MLFFKIQKHLFFWFLFVYFVAVLFILLVFSKSLTLHRFCMDPNDVYSKHSSQVGTSEDLLKNTFRLLDNVGLQKQIKE
jgi:hypothetical protein